MKKKEPGVSAVLSFFIPGLGQIYNGQFGKGFMTIMFLIISWALVFCHIGIVLVAIIWVWSILDAYKTADRKNKEIEESSEEI